MKNANITLDTMALQKFADGRFQYIQEHLTDGNTCWSNEISRPVKLAGLALTMRGDVVALMDGNFSLAKLTVNGTPMDHQGRMYDVTLSTESCGGVVRFNGNWNIAISEYNRNANLMGSTIIAYITL